MSDFTTEFLDTMRAAGFVPRDGKVHADDKWHPAYYGDERGNKCTGAYTMKIVDGSFAIGCFFTRKDPDNKHNWHSSSGETMTAEERRAQKEKLAAYEKAKREEEDRKYKRLSGLLTTAYKNLPKVKAGKIGRNDYLERKGIQPHGIKYRSKGWELIIPLYNPDGTVSTLQRITPNGGKFLFSGGKKKGAYFPFVKKGDSFDIILICEGFATGATLREATGLPVAAAIDAGNLIWVLDVLKSKFPKASFVLCADNDAFTFNETKRPKSIKSKDVPADDPRWNEWREAGILWNVGVEKARAAAVKCGGASVTFPSFEGLSITDKPTDFNDLAAIAGLQSVTDQVMAVVEAIPARGEAVEGMDTSRDPDQQHLDGGYIPPNPAYVAPDYPPEPPPFEPIAIEEKGDFGLRFRCLGHNGGAYYYFSFKERRIVSLTAPAHTIHNLLQLDDLDSWYNSKFGNGGEITEKKLALYAQNEMIKLCQSRGVFKEEDSVRGAGAWIDDSRIVVNCGDQLFVDGKIIPMNAIESEYTYIETPKFLRPDSAVPLTNSEAVMLKKICEMVTWENPLSGSLLAGWLVIAPVCGALEYSKGMEYRPHIWITGEAESGKSTVIRRIVRVVLGRIAINVEGGTTEAALRDFAGHDARPIVYDEAEPDKTGTMENVIALARKATTGGTVGKYGQGMMRIRFAACFSSINPPISKTADESRISLLTIKKNKKANAIEQFEELSRLMDEHLTDDFSRRLIARTIENMPVLLDNIRTFQRAARRVVKSARASEQIGTMLAGLYLLHNTNRIAEEEAEKFIRRYKWNDHTAADNMSEPEKLLQFLSGAILRFTSSTGISKDLTIGELIMSASNKGCDEDKFLRRYGIARVGQDVYFAVRHDNMQKLLRGTDWIDSYAARLQEIDGSEKQNQSFYFASGVRTSAVKVPLSLFREQNHQSTMDYNSEQEPEYIEEIDL